MEYFRVLFLLSLLIFLTTMSTEAMATVSSASAAPLPTFSLEAVSFMEAANMGPHNGFIHEGPAQADHVIELEFRVKLKNIDLLEKSVLDISTPGSPNYGKRFTKQELDDMVANVEGTELVTSFLNSIGATITKKSSNGSIMSATAPVSVWNAALNADFQVFHTGEFEEQQQRVVRTLRYSLPQSVASQVSAVFNTVQFPTRAHHGPVMSGGPKRQHHN